MNYLDWNHLLGQHFFNPDNAGKEIFLYSSKADITGLFKQSAHYLPFLQELEDESGEDANNRENSWLEQQIWEDFCSAMRRGFISSAGKSKSFFDKLQDGVSITVKRYGYFQGRELEYPPCLALLVSLVLPLADHGDDLSANNYYDRTIHWLYDNLLFTKEERRLVESDYEGFKTSFSNRFRKADHCWQSISEWSLNYRNGEWGSFRVKISGSFAHVGKAFAECIITQQQRQLIPLLFEKADISPGGQYPLSLFKQVLARHGQVALRYPSGKWHSIIKHTDLTDLLTAITIESYRRWNGAVRLHIIMEA